MFDGLVIKGGESAELDAEHGEVFHLSQACLNDPKDNGKTYVKITEGERSMVICCLQKDKCEHAALDIFIHPSQASFKVEGKNEVHLVGYWEPQGDSDDEGDLEGLMGDEAEESDGGEESDLKDEVPSLLNGNKKPHAMESVAKAGDDDSDDEEDEEDVSDSEEDELPSGPPPKAGKGLAAAGASANKQKPQQNKGAPQGAAPKGKAAPKAAASAPAEAQAGKRKQPPTDKAATQPPAKQAKTAAAPAAKASADGGDDKFEHDLTEYLTKHGRTSMSELGSKVKKPAGVSKKLAAFLKDRATMFKVDGSHVEVTK